MGRTRSVDLEKAGPDLSLGRRHSYSHTQMIGTRGFTNKKSDSVLAALAATVAPYSSELPPTPRKSKGDLTPLVEGTTRSASKRHRLTRLQASINLVKCAIGAGSFSLPFAFKEGGLGFSFVGTLFLGWISAYTVNILAQSERRVWHKHEAQEMGLVLSTPSPQPSEKSKFTYAELGRQVFPTFEVHLWGERYLNIMEAIIYAGIALTGLGVCAAYVDFITSTIPTVFTALTPVTTTLILAPIFWGLSLLRSYKFLAFTSVLGDIAVTAGIVSVVVYGAMNHGLSFNQPQFELETFPRFIGSTSFLFAIHIVILPIMQSMKNREKFDAVVYGSYTFITVLNGIFGALCYTIFGAGTLQNVVHNLTGSIFLDVVKVLLCVDLMFSLPMVLAAAREVVEEAAMEGVTSWVETKKNLLRTFLVAMVFVICFGVPDFGDMVSLVGGFVNSLMGFILPPLIYMKLQHDDKRLTTASMIGHSTIVVFGAAALVVSTYFTINQIIHPPAHH